MYHRKEIERTLGHTLDDVSTRKVNGLAELTPYQIAVAEQLASRNLVACALFLTEVTGVRLPEAMAWIDMVSTH